MPALLFSAYLSLYLALDCLDFLMGCFILTNPKTKFYFILLAAKSNVYKLNFFYGGAKFHFSSHVKLQVIISI